MPRSHGGSRLFHLCWLRGGLVTGGRAAATCRTLAGRSCRDLQCGSAAADWWWGSSGSSSSSSLSLKALTIQDAEGWAWALYQCGGPGSAEAKVSPEEAAEAQAAVVVAARRRKAAMPTFFGRGGRQQQP